LKSKGRFPIAVVRVRVRSSQAAAVLSTVSGVALLLLSFGCNSGSRSINIVTISRAEYERLRAGESRRFQPFSDGVALDTQTRQLCKTYDWHSHLARRGYGVVTPSPYENAPLCTVFGHENSGSGDSGSVTIPRTEYDRLQAAQLKRFQPFSNLAGVALDTQTGQVCKTSEPPIQPGRVPKVVIVSPYENAPFCANLH
jgi:hypothetical protein